jgi:lipid-A-disaccharide synthase
LIDHESTRFDDRESTGFNQDRPVCVMLVAGEASGDRLGASLAAALKQRLGGRLRLVGVGGAAMAREGIRSPFEIAQLSVLGIVEGLMAYPRVVRLAEQTAELARREQPDLAVLIDSWGFNLRVAARLRRAAPGALLVKYVAPQVWASRPGRAKTLAGAVDHLLSINSLDAAYFEPAGLSTTFVGSPALAREPGDADPSRLRTGIGAAPQDPILLIAPGSRPAEIARLGAPFADAAQRLKHSHPGLKIVVPVAETVAAPIRAWASALPPDTHLIEDEAGKRDAMAAATVALACSGTVTTELALFGCPMVVGYRLGALTYAILNRILTAKYITLFNLAGDEAIAPEFVQGDCTGPNLAAALALRLDQPALRDAQVAKQNAALAIMGRGGPDPSERAADTLVRLLGLRLAASV